MIEPSHLLDLIGATFVVFALNTCFGGQSIVRTRRREAGYGHMPWRDNMSVQERFLQDYQSWLKEQSQSHQPGRFRAWLRLICEQKDTRRTSRVNP